MLYQPVKEKNIGWEERGRRNWESLEACDRDAAERAVLVGRYITEPVADGHAVYQVIKENKKTVRIRVCTGLGDDWRVNYWGDEATVDKEYVLSLIRWREKMKELFIKR